MCIILIKPKADLVIPDYVLDNAEIINPDGFGITYLDKPETIKTMDYDKARELVESPRPFVAHYRYATKGSVAKRNCHPFPFRDLEGICWRLYMNGTVPHLGGKKSTDASTIANLLGKVPRDYWRQVLRMSEARFALVSEKSETLHFGKWIEGEGILYSKGDVLDEWQPVRWGGKSTGRAIGFNQSAPKPKAAWDEWDEAFDMDEAERLEMEAAGRFDWEDLVDDSPELGDLVAVYGTLKSGRGNSALLHGAIPHGKARTCQRYAMVDRSIPYVFDDGKNSDGYRIDVELYEPTSAKQWNQLDALERHPEHYTRHRIAVETEEGDVLTAWLYFAGPMVQEPGPEEMLIANF